MTVAVTVLVAVLSAFAPLVAVRLLPGFAAGSRPAVEPSAIKVVLTVWLLFTVAVTVWAPASVAFTVVLATPAASVVTGLLTTVEPAPVVKLTATPATGLPFASVTVAVTVLVAVLSAFAPLVAVRLLPGFAAGSRPAVPLSAVNIIVTLRVVPLMPAVTSVLPAVLLVRVCVTVPSAPVVPVAANSGAVIYREIHSTPGTGCRCCPSRSPPRCWRPSRWRARYSLPPSAGGRRQGGRGAVRHKSQAHFLTVTVNGRRHLAAAGFCTGQCLRDGASAPVLPLAAMVAPFVALKLTATPGTRLPFASVTITFTLLVTRPSAVALSVTIFRLRS
ncbi:Uncharacterised protein [Citrobacter freundii]|nr:Uncharacterised protein [Citrobacter freundii]